jgi:hypothetical protein
VTAYVPSLNERDLTKYAISLQQLASGRSNGVGTVTCSTLSSTTVTDANCAAGSRVQLTASSSNAAAATVWVTSASNGSFVIGHTVASSTDRTFNYAVIG